MCPSGRASPAGWTRPSSSGVWRAIEAATGSPRIPSLPVSQPTPPFPKTVKLRLLLRIPASIPLRLCRTRSHSRQNREPSIGIRKSHSSRHQSIFSGVWRDLPRNKAPRCSLMAKARTNCLRDINPISGCANWISLTSSKANWRSAKRPNLIGGCGWQAAGTRAPIADSTPRSPTASSNCKSSAHDARLSPSIPMAREQRPHSLGSGCVEPCPKPCNTTVCRCS